MADNQQRTDRGFDRLVNFSDAVVAIVITLLALPLVDVATQLLQGQTSELTEAGHGVASVFDLMTENGNGDIFIGFTITFFVTAVFWLIHHKIFEFLGDYDSALMWLNMIWLFLIVLFPFLSGLISVDGFANGAGLLYCGLMAALSGLLGIISWHARRKPELLAEGVTPDDVRNHRALWFVGFFLFVGLVSLFQPDIAQYLMFGLIPIGRFTR